MKVLIAGAGLAGLSAGVLIKRMGHDVTVVEKRNFIGGNCNDHTYNGVYVHEYGPHIFHTNHEDVWAFLNEFTSFTDYNHKVVAKTGMGEELYPIPYSEYTEACIGMELTDEQIRKLFFVQYSEKMWGCKFDEIPTTITGRVNLRRDNWDASYFTDKYQGMPAAGYFSMFARMAAEIGKQNIRTASGAYLTPDLGVYDHVVYTGRLDEYWNTMYGALPYRALQFDCKHSMPVAKHAVVNFCDNTRPATRETDFSLLYPHSAVSHTVICREYPKEWSEGCPWEPSYPMRGFTRADELVAKYEALGTPDHITFAGRLGLYKYMNMDAVVKDVMDRVLPRLENK